jgi:hypothetical protein
MTRGAHKGIVFTDQTVNMLVVAVLVQKLGGAATITQGDIDQVAFHRLLESPTSDGSICLELTRSHGGTA